MNAALEPFAAITGFTQLLVSRSLVSLGVIN
jgi:hypothetical protein